MAISELAGKPVDPSALVDVGALLAAYHDTTPDPADPAQRVAFGTSGHRGSSFRGAFNEAHILAITEAICRYRLGRGYSGPLFLGRDTHALSEPATRTALGVLVANGVDVRIDASDGYTPTPAVSHAIITANRPKDSWRHLADGIVVTPSHNPPDDGGFKYNPPNGGPADTDVTGWIQDEANRILEAPGVTASRGSSASPMPTLAWARRRTTSWASTSPIWTPSSIWPRSRSPACASASTRWAAHRSRYWGAIAERYDLDLTVTNDKVDPQFGFMTADWDGKIRMDPSSAARDGATGGPARRFRYRARQRRRRRPPWRRHPERRAAQPEPLPVRGDRLPVRRGARLGP